MTVRYVGIGGSDSNDGLSWANRKATLNGVEDTPVQAGDVVYVGPGNYRETLTVDVAGTNGSPVTYIGDAFGEHTDGIGGLVRISGSNDDVSVTRTSAINAASGKNYRTFRGFQLDGTTSYTLSVQASSNNWIVEDCLFLLGSSTAAHINFAGTGTGHIVRRCFFYASGIAVGVNHTSTVNDANILIENCIAFGGYNTITVRIDRVGGVTVKNCTFHGGGNAVRVLTALAVGQVCTVNNCILSGFTNTLSATTTAEFSEDYNLLFSNANNYSNVTAGSNTVTTYLVLPEIAPLLASHRYGAHLASPSIAFGAAHKAGTGEPTDDFYGLARPTTAAKKSWGAVQSYAVVRETTTIDGASGASLKLADAGRVQFRVPVTNVSTTFSVKVYREADYAGTLPQLVIKQPGQSDTTVVDTGSAGQWNTLTTTLTPASVPTYVIIELVSNNTATSGAYDVFFDTIAVT